MHGGDSTISRSVSFATRFASCHGSASTAGSYAVAVHSSVSAGAAQPLDDAQVVRVERAVVGQPRLIVEVLRLDDERVAFPMADGVASGSSARCSSDAAGRRSARCRKKLPDTSS